MVGVLILLIVQQEVGERFSTTGFYGRVTRDLSIP